jgi:hypothetical protein
MIRLALLLSAVLLAVLPAPAQVVPEAGSMAATERYLFVRRGDEIFQLEIHSLRILKRVRLPAAEPVVEPEPVIEEPGPDPGGVEGGIEVDPKEPEEVVPDEAVLEPLEIEDEGPERQAGAGGKYGGRAKGGEELARRGGKASATAIQLGIDWLVRHQAVDGRWDADAFMERELAGERSDGPGLAVHDVGVTGLALLALLGDGNSLRSGPQRESVRRAVAWLREQQDPATGLIGTTSHHSFIYDHAIATLAMVEAYGLSEYKLLKSSAQRAIDYLEFHRNPYAVWRYQPRDGVPLGPGLRARGQPAGVQHRHGLVRADDGPGVRADRLHGARRLQLEAGRPARAALPARSERSDDGGRAVLPLPAGPGAGEAADHEHPGRPRDP